MLAPLSRRAAWDLLCEWTESESLRRHALAVEAAMRAYARRDGEDEELWGQTGLLHDLDYERHPDRHGGHPRHAMRELEERGYPAEMIRAIGAHADYMGIERTTPLERTLAAVDELSGFLVACAFVRPQGIEGLTPRSVRKKLGQPSFAAGVDRASVRREAEELGVDFDDHVAFVIAALAEHAAELGLSGAPVSPVRP